MFTFILTKVTFIHFHHHFLHFQFVAVGDILLQIIPVELGQIGPVQISKHCVVSLSNTIGVLPRACHGASHRVT